MSRFREMKGRAQDQDFSWQNKTITELVAKSDLQSLSYTARSMIMAIMGDENLRHDKFMMSFAYCFAGRWVPGKPQCKKFTCNWANLNWAGLKKKLFKNRVSKSKVMTRVLLGMDFLNEYGAKLDLVNGMLVLIEVQVPFCFKNPF